ncbi:MAG: glycosyltransferase [Actinomycetota bacterium]|nr:glycosyltransferase [Actinomycetota bacterium]
MIRALFLTKHLRVGGAQRNWTILLPALAERGFATRLVTLEDEGEFFEEVRARGVPVTCEGMRGRLDLRAARQVLGLAASRPEVIVTHDERSHLLGRALAWRAGAAHVASDHGGPGFALKAHRELLLRLVAPGFATTVTMSEQRVPDLLRRGFRRERIHVVANGVDAAALRPSHSREAVRAALKVPDEAFVALLPAVLRPEKRADRFVRAVSRASAVDPRVRGLVVGYGPDEDRVRRLAAEVGGAVAVLGHRRDIADFMAASDVVCLTSDVEGGPYAALEAMALGKPVAAMRAGALDEVVVDGKTGLLVPPADEERLADALITLARDPPRAAALGAAGRERQRAHFDAIRMSDAYAALLRTVVTARWSTSTRAGTATATE